MANSAMSLKSKCLVDLFKYLDEIDIPFCVVGDSSKMPDMVSSDVDIVISRDDFTRIEKIISDFSFINGYEVPQSLWHEHTAVCFVITVSHGCKFVHLYPDICSDYYLDGVRMMLAEELLKNKVQALYDSGVKKGFCVPSADDEFKYYLLKKIGKGALNAEQFEHLKHQYFLMPNECKLKIFEFLPNEKAELVCKAMLNSDIYLLKEQLAFLKESMFKNKERTSLERYSEFKRKFKRIVQPTGLVVSLMGPDGAGKTAIGYRIDKELTPVFRGNKKYHLRPQFFGVTKSDELVVADDPHGKPVRGSISSILKLLYFIADYFIGYISSIYFLKRRSYLILFDRYFHDLLVDPIRYRYGAPRVFVEIASWFIPRPDLFIVLDAPVEVIQERKKEVSAEETKRQREAYLVFARGQPNCLVLDSSIDIDETVKMGTQAILEFMNDRMKKRMDLK